MAAGQISPASAATGLQEKSICLLDVREDWERDTASLPGTLNIPMDRIPDSLGDIRERCGGRTLVVMCRSGVRSMTVANFLNHNGFSGVLNLDGGILAWSEQVDPTIPRY